MTDIIDRGCETEELNRQMALKHQAAHPPELPAIGECYNCEARLPAGVKFCDCDCRNDYDVRKSAAVRHWR